MQATNPYDGPEQTSAMSSAADGGLRTLHIKQIDVLSVGKLLGCLYALIGLIAGGIMSLFALLGAVGGGGGDAAITGLVVGVGAIIFVPLFYGVIGFIGGLLGALFYNIVAGFVGGIRIDVEL